jgi:hypothetical protein
MSDTPPSWADTWLRLLLAARDRDTVSGDLMEEYRENVRPRKSRLAADVWYLRQVSRFAWRPGLWAVFLATIFISRTAFDWFIPTTNFGPRAEATTLVMISTLLVIGASSALRTQSIQAGIVTAATALSLSAMICTIATTVMYAGWRSPQLMGAINASGGLAEVYTLPILLIVPGTIISAIGATIAGLRPPAKRRSTDE